jgi:hypothetical protein
MGAAAAKEAARSWSKTSSRYTSDADFDRDWASYKTKPGGISGGTLVDVAEKTGFDLEPWRDLTQAATTVVATAATSSLIATFGGAAHAAVNTPFFSPVKFDAPDLEPVLLALGLLIRGEIAVLAGMGGGAKTALAVLVATALAAGLTTIGPFKINNRPEGLRVAFISAEETGTVLGCSSPPHAVSWRWMPPSVRACGKTCSPTTLRKAVGS